MLYTHRFKVTAPLDKVVRFHTLSSSMAAITPPPIVVRMHQAPSTLVDGDEIIFTMWLAFIPVRWHARIENVTPTGFIDRQLAGPFKIWEHTHQYKQINPDTTEILDKVRFEFKNHPFWWLVGTSMAAGLPLLFAYRAWKSRKILQKSRSS